MRCRPCSPRQDLGGGAVWHCAAELRVYLRKIRPALYLETWTDAGCESRNSSNDSLGIEICCPPLAADMPVPAPLPTSAPAAAPGPPPATLPTRAPSPAPRRPRLVVLPPWPRPRSS